MILERKPVQFNSLQKKMIISGWGEEAYNNSILESILYGSDGLKIGGYVAYPKEYAHKLPCIFWCRGGIGNSGVIDSFTAKGILGRLASEGYAVFYSHYRGNSISEGFDEVGGSDINDILNLMELSSELACADPERWGLEGWSRGGMMALLTLMNSSASIKTVVLAGAITNIKNYLEGNGSGLKSEIEKYYKTNFTSEINKRNIIDQVDKLPQIAYLIMHGKDDKTVPYEQSVQFSKALIARKVLNELILFEGAGHHLKEAKGEVERTKLDWYKKYLH